MRAIRGLFLVFSEDAVLAEDLQPGDVLLSAALGGRFGRLTSVRVYPDSVAISAGLLQATLGRMEVCTVRRRAP